MKVFFKFLAKAFFWGMLCGIIGLILITLRYGNDMPDYKSLAAYAPPVATRLYASDGSLLIEYAAERRVFIDYDDLPPALMNAFIAAEDRNFWSHPGIDALSVLRALANNAARLFGKRVQLSGASTITQQVAKNFFLTNERTFARKIREGILALRLERSFSKKHIITLYMNQIFLGARAYGVGAASLMYFNKPVDALTLGESAFLASLPKAPNDRVRATERRDYVLRRMLEEGFITNDEYVVALAEELYINRGFTEQQSDDFQYFAEEVRRRLLEDLGRDTLYNGGLYIKTTIVPKFQKAASEALKAELDLYNQKIKDPNAPRLQGAIMAMNPHTGRVLAVAGGYSFAESSYNRATQARRQIGSTIKPFIYLHALEQGDLYTPETLLLDAPIVGWKEDNSYWKPENYDRKFLGPVPLRLSLENSRNVPTVRLVQSLGIRRSVYAAQRFGVYPERLSDVNISMALGSGETTLEKLLIGYSAFVNGGFRRVPRYVDYIQDRYGKLVFGFGANVNLNLEYDDELLPPVKEEASEPLSDPQSLYQLISILQGVVDRGTGRQARVAGHTIAGKTGTTNEFKDVWFVGFSKNLAAGVYLGFDEPQTLGPGTGSFMAARVFSEFMKVALEFEENQPFAVPDGLEFRRVNRSDGVAAADSPDGVIINEAFKPGQKPNPKQPSVGKYDKEAGAVVEVGGVF
ncbi:MAG: PBP1A family penicillin-binding protein [Rickettsiales bacterium]|jgi:penicillin-binding protein 1A|nr:PBP1A family penicillin-binding protein [Rickettsiales bacterium]